jgi:hypothetical protein
MLPPDHIQPHSLLQECVSKAQTLVDSVNVEEVISALVLLDALARKPGHPREKVSCNRRIMARLVELCCVAPRKDILITSLSVNFPSSRQIDIFVEFADIIVRFLRTAV